MRRLPIFALFAVVLFAACSQQGGEPDVADPTTTSGDTMTTTEATTADPTTTEGSDTTTPPETTVTTSGRPAAPDFTLELGDGGTYTLADGAKPVYLVFWAEW